MKHSLAFCCSLVLLLVSSGMQGFAQTPVSNDPLPSWNDGPRKAALLTFVDRVTRDSSPDFVPIEDRIAVFDNDGTLWTEQPNYSQMFFVLDRIKTLAPEHPKWKDQEPFASVLKGETASILASGEQALVSLLMATHAGMTNDEFEKIVQDWISTATHPTLRRPYPECVYQPMLELLTYLRANEFQTYIVSGGGIEFMRPWVSATYGVHRHQVIGSSIKTQFELRQGTPVIVRLPEVDFVDDGPGKPVGIDRFIGKRPIAAFGNSDGDLQMLQWTTAGQGARLGLIVHHTDAAREFAYDRHSHVGKLDHALDAAKQNGWTVVDMKTDWKTIFPSQEHSKSPSQP